MKGRALFALALVLISAIGLLLNYGLNETSDDHDVAASAYASKARAPGDPQEAAATMFLLLFTTSLVGLYVAARHLKRSGFSFMMSTISGEGSKAEKAPELEPGAAYLVTQGQDKALKVFTQELKKGRPGLCITRTYPEKLQESWDLKGARTLWLSSEPEDGKLIVNSLDTLSTRILEFLTGEEPGVVLLDGLEYLFVQNSFTEVMRLLQNLKDALPPSGSRLIIPIDLLALVERQRALLTREFSQV